MFTCHRLSPTNKLDCPHAVGTDAFSAQRAESFRHFLLLPPLHSTPSLRSVAQGRLRLFTTDASRRIFESALERVRRSYRTLRLRVHSYAGACSPPAQRTATGGFPTQVEAVARRLSRAPKSRASRGTSSQTRLEYLARPVGVCNQDCHRQSGKRELKS